MPSSEEALTVLGILITVVATIWVLRVSLYKSQQLERRTTFDFATRQLETSVKLVVEKPEHLALRRFLTIEALRENYRGQTVSAACDGMKARCRQRPLLMTSTIRVQVDLKDVPGPKAELMLLMKADVPSSEILEATQEYSPIISRVRSPEAIMGNLVRRSTTLHKRAGILTVRNYVEEFQLPARSVSTLLVEVTENGNRRALDPSYIFVSRTATLDDLRKKRAALGEKDPFSLQIPVDLVYDTTVITATHAK